MKAGTAPGGRRSLAVFTAVLMLFSLVLGLARPAEADHVAPNETVENDGNEGSNETPFWVDYLETQRDISGAVCEKITLASSEAWVMPAEDEGENWVLLVVKQGETNFLYYDPIAGHTYPSVGQNGPGYSHIIVCSTLEEEPPPWSVSASVALGACEFDEIYGSFSEVTITITPDAQATVTIDHEDGTAFDYVVSSSTTVLVPPGLVTWTAVAAPGNTLTTPANGSFQVGADCMTACPVFAPGSIVVNLSSVGSLLANQGPAAARKGPVPVNIPAGVYDITLTSFDTHTDKPGQETSQTQEQYFLEGFNGGVDTGWTSSAISDLPTPINYLVEQVDTAVSVPALTALFTTHLLGADGNASGPHSIRPGCVAFTPVTQNVDVQVSWESCVIGEEGPPSGQVTVTVDPEAQATVNLYDSSDNLIHAFTSASETLNLAPGDYHWETVAEPGYTPTGDTSGEFTIEECEQLIEVEVSGVCENDAPYLSWDVTPVNLSATEVTIIWNDIDPANPLHSSVQPLSGTMPWPGTEFDSFGNVSDWAGWVFENGIWSPGTDGFENTRPQASVTFSVNPTETLSIEYPGGEPECEGPPPEVFVDLEAVCDNDTPYLEYSATLSGNVDPAADTVTIHWFDKNGVERNPADTAHTYTGLPLSGRVLWPGARIDSAGDPTDWPGWVFSNNEWIQTDDGFLWAREAGAFVTLEVNPTSDQLTVSYPPANPTCSANPPDEVSDVEVDDDELPFTGIDAGTLAGIAVVILGSGLVVVMRSRRLEDEV